MRLHDDPSAMWTACDTRIGAAGAGALARGRVSGTGGTEGGGVFSGLLMNTWIAATIVALIAGVTGFFAAVRRRLRTADGSRAQSCPVIQNGRVAV